MSIHEFREPEDIPVDQRVMAQLIPATIRNFVDVIVELVTNCDDSYRMLEERNITTIGEIYLFIERLKGGKCKKLTITDSAEGMDLKKLNEATIYSKEISGFEKGRSVRGLFGRGLKEAILALGKGTVYTIKDGKLSIARLYWDEAKKKYQREIIKKSYIPSPEESKKIGISKGAGTHIEITVTNEKIRCPDYKTLKPQICNHFALRDINSSPRRKLHLDFESPTKHGLKISSPISYQKPKGKEIYNQEIKLPGYGDDVKVKIWESNIELESPYNNPFARAGLLIKTAGAILDNKLFKYTQDSASLYFFGEVICEGIAKKIRQGDFGLIDPNRGGIEWLHQYCKVLQNELEKILDPFIEKKRSELEKGKPAVKQSEKTKKMLNTVCHLLNRFAKQEITEMEDMGGEGIKPGEKINELTIKPEIAHIEINKERHLSVYAPKKILSLLSQVVKVTSDNREIQILDSSVSLYQHPKYPEIHYGKFRIIGRKIGEVGIITCELGEHGAISEVRIIPQSKKGRKKGKLMGTGPKGGFFAGIDPDLRDNPLQRVAYEESTSRIRVFVKFPVVEKYLDATLEPKSNEAKAILAELIGEAFCRFLARRLVGEKYPIMHVGGDIDAFNIAMNDLQKKYLHKIHGTILKYK